MKSLFIALSADRWKFFFSASQREAVYRDFEILHGPSEEPMGWGGNEGRLERAEILLTGWGVGGPAPTLRTQNLKLVLAAAGSVQGLVPNCKQEVEVISASPALGFGVAEYCMSMLVNAAKRLHWLANAVAGENRWRDNTGRFGPWFELYGSTVGIIGFGCSGRALATLLQPHGCRVLAYDPFVSAQDMAEFGVMKVDSLDAVFSSSRAVCLLAAVNDSSRGMIGGAQLRALADGSVFINAARPALLRQDEIVEELQRQRIVAVIDVAEEEPPTPDHPFRQLPNVIFTPHVAGAVAENRRRMGDYIFSALYSYAEPHALLRSGLPGDVLSGN